MSYIGTPPANRILSSADIAQGAVTLDDINFTDQPVNMDIAGTIDKHTMRLADGVTITGDVTISDDLVLAKLSDDGDAITMTNDESSRTITGSGSIEASTLAQTPNQSLTGMTGTPTSINISNATGSQSSITLTPTATESAPAGSEGALYYNSTLNALMQYDGSAWGSVWGGVQASASGGTETAYTGYKVHTFSTSGTFTVMGVALTCDVLLVGGGGGGGCGACGGGGGAGGMVVSPSVSVPVGVHFVSVGAGASGGPANTSAGTANQGGHSSFLSPLCPTAIGGGGGVNNATNANPGGDGGSGGGGHDGGGGKAVLGQGKNGEDSVGGVNAIGGGGGAGEQGGTDGDRYGGDGLQNLYQTGSNIYYAGGGGGSENSDRATVDGGLGGGAVGYATNLAGAAGVDGLGGGGGGAGENVAQPGGDGGDGIVIIRYAV